jgi:hypothetical protein
MILNKFFVFVLAFALWLILISNLWPNPTLLLLILIILISIYFIFLKEKNDIVYFLIAAIFGPIGEAIVSASGLWKYYGQTVFGVPYWLPLAWGITAIMIKRFIASIIQVKDGVRRNN